jgi:hypothetical protein
LRGHAAEARKGSDVRLHQRMHVTALMDRAGIGAMRLTLRSGGFAGCAA